MRIHRIVLILPLLVAACSTGIYCYRSTADIQLLVTAAEGDPTPWAVIVGDPKHSDQRLVPDDGGRVDVWVPPLAASKHFLFGLLVHENGSLHEPIVHVTWFGIELVALTLKELTALPLDADGQRVLDFGF
jgi:hypothetical protein